MTLRAGFTLIEMMVAIAIFGFVSLATLSIAGAGARAAAQAEARVYAALVAENLLVETMLAPSEARTGPMAGGVEQGGRAFLWERRVSATSDPALLRIDVAVRPQDAPEEVVRFSGFAGAR